MTNNFNLVTLVENKNDQNDNNQLEQTKAIEEKGDENLTNENLLWYKILVLLHQKNLMEKG